MFLDAIRAIRMRGAGEKAVVGGRSKVPRALSVASLLAAGCLVGAGCTVQFDPSRIRDGGGQSHDADSDAAVDSAVDAAVDADAGMAVCGEAQSGCVDGAACSIGGAEGRCHRGICCTGCWDESTLRCQCGAAQSEITCGLGGAVCESCIAPNGACSAGGCQPSIGVAQLGLANMHGCLVDTDGAARCWGRSLVAEGLGGASRVQGEVHRIESKLRFRQVSAGRFSNLGHHSCGISEDGEAHCWGEEPSGAIGSTTPSATPIRITPPAAGRWTWIVAAERYSCGIFEHAADAARRLYCWGNDGLNDWSTMTSSTVPLPVDETSPDLIELVPCGHGGLVIAEESGVHRLYSFGTTLLLGRAPGSGLRLVEGLATVTSVAASGRHALVLTPAGTIFGWGRGEEGQLGALGDTDRPARIDQGEGWPDADWLDVAAGQAHSCGLRREDGDPVVFCWGSNSAAQLGVESASLSGSTLPVRVPLPPLPWAQVHAAGDRSCAVSATGALFCWGSNTVAETTGNVPTAFTLPLQLHLP